jgi:Putative zinc-finger
MASGQVILEPRLCCRVPRREPVTQRIALMDCRAFRENHVGFVDDVLPAIDMEAMHRHLRSCGRCARHDLAVRRGLLIVRNLPPIEPSADFMSKLSERIAELQSTGAMEPAAAYRLTTGGFAALAAGLTLFAYATLEAKNHFGAPETLTLPPVVATAPASPAPPLSAPAYMAAISTGMPLWPAVLMADEAPRQMANVELQQAALR